MPPVRRNRSLWDDRPSWGFRLWFAFCTVLGLGIAGVVVWLIITVIQWIGRH